jgi:hypothetical protein
MERYGTDRQARQERMREEQASPCPKTGSVPLGETTDFWRPRVGRELNQEDARQIAENLCAFFRVLMEWEVASKQRTSYSEASSTSNNGPKFSILMACYKLLKSMPAIFSPPYPEISR